LNLFFIVIRPRANKQKAQAIQNNRANTKSEAEVEIDKGMSSLILLLATVADFDCFLLPDPQRKADKKLLRNTDRNHWSKRFEVTLSELS